MFGYPWTQVTGQFRFKSDFRRSGRARSDGFDPPKPKSTRKSDQNYPNIPESTLYYPEFDVESKYAIKTMLGARNLELQLPIETTGQAHQLDIPTRSDGFGPAEPKSTRKSDKKYPSMTKMTPNDQECDAYSNLQSKQC